LCKDASKSVWVAISSQDLRKVLENEIIFTGYDNTVIQNKMREVVINHIYQGDTRSIKWINKVYIPYKD